MVAARRYSQPDRGLPPGGGFVINVAGSLPPVLDISSLTTRRSRLPHLPDHGIRSPGPESKFRRIWTPNGLRVTSSATWKRAPNRVSGPTKTNCAAKPRFLGYGNCFRTGTAISDRFANPASLVRNQEAPERMAVAICIASGVRRL